MRIFFLNMVSVSFFVSIFIVFFLLVNWRKNKKRVYILNYYIGLFIAFRLLLCFPLNLPFTSNHYELRSSSIEDNEKNIPEQDLGKESDTLEIVPKEQQDNFLFKIQSNVINILIRIWLIGFAVIIVVRTVKYIYFRHYIMNNGMPVGNEIYQIYMSVVSELNYNYCVRLIKVKNISSPLTLGFMEKAIVIPDIDYETSEIDISYIFRHELIHIKNHDNWYKLLMAISQSIHWFNPIIFLYYKTVERDIEYLCDTGVVNSKNINYRKEYCKNILQMMENEKTNKTIKIGTRYFSSFWQDKKNLKERMENILNGKERKVKKFVIGLLLLLLLGITSLLIFSSEKSNMPKWTGLGGAYYESTDVSDYGEFRESGCYSNFRIFPGIINDDMSVMSYLYQYTDTIFDPTSQIYMECTYEKDSYLREIERLQNISEEYNGEIKKVLYDTESFYYPAYVTIDADNHCYEYALILGDERIAYVFLQFVNKEDIGFPSEYLPKEYESIQDSGYTIYIFYQKDGTGICVY